MKVVIDEEWILKTISRFESIEQQSMYDKGALIALRSIEYHSTPLSEVIQPLLTDAYSNALIIAYNTMKVQSASIDEDKFNEARDEDIAHILKGLEG